MKKILVVGVIAIMLTSLFVGLIPSSVVASPDWVIDGDTVYIDDSNAYLSASPHTITSGGYVYFNLTPKTYTGDIDVVWGFDVPNVKPTKAELYSPHWNNWTTNHEQFFYNVSSFSPSSDFCFYGNSYNSLHYNVTYETCDIWGETTFECESYKAVSSIVCFDSYTNEGNNYTVYWHTGHSKLILWKDISASFTKINYNHGGMNTWYYVKNVPVVAGKSYQVRAWVDVPISTDGANGKYWWAVKPSSETISQAIANNHFYALDPWYSSSWSHRKQWTVTNVNATTLTNFAAYVNVSDEPEMQSDRDDVVFTDSNSNLIPYELENYTSGYADYWVNVTIPASSSVSGWMYYGNAGASSQENPEGVWDSHTKMVHHSQDLIDSTSNDNDATNHGATYNSSGKIDGAFDYNGSSDYWDCGNDASLNITDAITIEALVKWDVSGTFKVVAGRTDDGYKGWLLRIPSSSYIEFSVAHDNPNRKVYTASYTWTNEWTHIVAVYDGSEVAIYINGSSLATPEAYINGISYTSSRNLQIGKFPDLDLQYLNGTIDEVRISSTARSADWINQSYELVVNQSTWVSWGSAECQVATPVNLGNTYNNFWVNWSWQAGNDDCLQTDGYNTSWSNDSSNGWQNSTATYFNHTTIAHDWVNVSVYAWNSTEDMLSESAASGQQQIPNNAPVITNTSDWQGNEGELVYLDFNYTDADSDTCTFSTNATEGSLNTTTGVFEWQTDMASQGTYFWNFVVSDGWSGEDNYVANITVNDLYHPDITDWWNNYTSNNLTHFTILVGDNRTVFFNVTSNQSGMTWYWYKDGDLMQSSSQANYTATWDVGGIGKEIRVYGSNPNGNTESLYWIIYIEYTVHEIEWLKYEEMQKQTEAEEMLGLSILLVVLIVVALVLLLSGILVPHSVLTLLGSMTFFVTMVLPIPVLSNYPYFGIALTSILLLFGLIGVIITFYQFFTTYNSDKGYHKWDDYFDNQ